MTGEREERALDRGVAQFFFEIGYGACWAEAFVRAGSKPPFPLTDAFVEHAWEIAGEAHDDPVEFDAYLARAAMGDEAQERDAAGEGEDTYAGWQQRRGRLPDLIEDAIAIYDSFMKDDDYDAQRCLDRVITELRSARDWYDAPPASPTPSTDNAVLVERLAIGALRLEQCCDELAAGRPQAAYDAMILAGQSVTLIELDIARRTVREALAALRSPSMGEI